MILVDTSVWIDHLRTTNTVLVNRLEQQRVLCHPLVLGELACGNLANRPAVLAALSDMPSVREASHAEVLTLIERQQLFGTGLGFTYAHLLASTMITPGTRLWTRVRRLHRVVRQLGLAPGERD